eukprot:jgi/Bigna1/133770/aug1.22_g8478
MSDGVGAEIQFLKGLREKTVPKVKVLKNPTDDSSVAIFRFRKPSFYNVVDLEQEVDGMSMVDMEGTITATEVTAHFSESGVPETIEAKYKMKNDEEWDRYDMLASEAEEAALDPKDW